MILKLDWKCVMRTTTDNGWQRWWRKIGRRKSNDSSIWSGGGGVSPNQWNQWTLSVEPLLTMFADSILVIYPLCVCVSVGFCFRCFERLFVIWICVDKYWRGSRVTYLKCKNELYSMIHQRYLFRICCVIVVLIIFEWPRETLNAHSLFRWW